LKEKRHPKRSVEIQIPEGAFVDMYTELQRDDEPHDQLASRMIWIDSKIIYFLVKILLLDVDIEIGGVYSPSFAVRKTANVFTRR